MPAAVVWVVSAIGAEIGSAALIMYATEIASAVLLVGGMAYSAMKSRQARAAARDAYNAAQVDRMVNVSSTVAPRELVMGRVRKGGAVFYKASTGRDQQELYLAIALAGHEIDAVQTIYLNDVAVSTDVDGWVTASADHPYARSVTSTDRIIDTSVFPDDYPEGTIESSIVTEYRTGGDSDPTPTGYKVFQYTATESYVQITSHLGQAGQGASPLLTAAFPSDWTSANVVDGIAYLVVRLSYNETAFPNGVPNVTAVIRGAKLYDPRTATTVWSENPALMLRHVYQHAKFGKATVSSAEDARFITAANACDTSTVYTVDGVAQDACALYRASLAVPFGAAPASVFDDLAQAMGGSWAFSGGELHLKAGTYTASVKSLTDADLAVIQRNGASETQKPISISVHKERAQKFNTVKAKIWDHAQDYKQVDLKPLVGSALLARDGVELVQEVTMPAIGYAPQALHVAGVMMRDARDPLVVDLPFKLSAYYIELFDTVDLTLARYGWTNKTFMVLSRTWTSDASLQLTLKETAAAITQMDADFLPQGFAANTNLPAPWDIVGVGTLTISSGTSELLLQNDGTVTSRMRVSWTQVADQAVIQNGHIDVRFRASDSTGAWTVLTVSGNETQVITSDVLDGAYYIVQARTRTSVAVSDWGTQVQHQVIGKTEPPSDVANLTINGDALSWSAVSDVDLWGYLIRFQYGTNYTWSTATPMHEGVITESPYLMVTRPSGQVTILVKAVDTTGNESTNAAVIATDLGDADVANVVETIDFDALSYPGTLTGCTLSGGNLLAGSAGGGNYTAMTYVTDEFTISAALAGSFGTLAMDTAGADLQVEYRIVGADSFYGADTDSFYGDDSESFYGTGSPWTAFPAQLEMTNATYQLRVQIAAGTTQGRINTMALTVDAPDIVENISNLLLGATGTVIPYTKAFASIENIQVTLITNTSGVETVEIDKTDPLAPVLYPFNVSHDGWPGARVDLVLKGY